MAEAAGGKRCIRQSSVSGHSPHTSQTDFRSSALSLLTLHKPLYTRKAVLVVQLYSVSALSLILDGTPHQKKLSETKCGKCYAKHS